MATLPASVNDLVKKLTGQTDVVNSDAVATVLADLRKTTIQDFTLSEGDLRVLLEEFVEQGRDALMRRWIGLLLFELLKRSKKVAETIIESLHDELPPVAGLIQQEPHEDIKYVAGRLMQSLLLLGAVEETFWIDERTGFEPETFPRRDSSQWVHEFNGFCTSKGRQHSSDVWWPLHATSKGFKFEHGCLFLTISGSFCTLINGASTTRVVDIPLKFISSIRQVEANVHGSPAQMETKITTLEFTLKPPHFFVDSKPMQSSIMNIGFRSVSDAKAVGNTVIGAQKHLPDFQLVKPRFATSGRLTGQDASMDLDEDEEDGENETPRGTSKRPHDGLSTPGKDGKLKPVSHKKARKIDSLLSMDEADETWNVPSNSPKRGKKTKQPGSRGAPKKSQTSKAKAATGRKNAQKARESQNPAADSVGAGAAPESLPSAVQASVTKKPHLVAFDADGPLNQPGSQQRTKRQSMTIANPVRTDKDGFALPPVPPRHPALAVGKEADVQPTQSINDIERQPESPSDCGIDDEHILVTEDTSPIPQVDSKLEGHNTQPMSARNIFSTPRKDKADRPQADSNKAVKSLPAGSQRLPIDVPDDSPEDNSSSSGASAFVDERGAEAEGDTAAVDTGKQSDAPTHEQYTADDVFREDELSQGQEQQQRLPSPNKGTGSQLSRRVNESGSPFSSQTRLPLVTQTVNPLVQQVRALNATSSEPHKKAAVDRKQSSQQQSARWDEDETLVENLIPDAAPPPNCRSQRSRIEEPGKDQKLPALVEHSPSIDDAAKAEKLQKRYIQHTQSSPSSSDHQSDSSHKESSPPAAAAAAVSEPEMPAVPLHHRGLLASLTMISRHLLSQVEDHETASKAIVRSYAEGASKLLNTMSEQHVQEADGSMKQLLHAKAKFKRGIEHQTRALAEDAEVAKRATEQVKRRREKSQKTLGAGIGAIDKMLKGLQAY